MKEYWRFSQIIAQQIHWRNVDLPNIFYEFIKKFPHKKEEKETGMDNSSIYIGVCTNYWLDLIYQCTIGDCLFDEYDETGFIHILVMYFCLFFQ